MPLERCQVDGLPGWRWGRRGKCYVGSGAKRRAIRQGLAIEPDAFNRLSLNRTKVVASNPLKADPTRTATLRRKFQAEITRRLNRLKRKIWQLVAEDDAFGLSRQARTAPAVHKAIFPRWQFRTAPEKVAAFQSWLASQVQVYVLPTIAGGVGEMYWQAYVEEGYRKGAGRAFDDTRAAVKAALDAASQEQLLFFEGTKAEFLRQSFAHPVAVEKVKLLAGRTFAELKNVTEDMSTKITRQLTDGLVQGMNPRAIARRMLKDGIGTKVRGVQSRALTIARTEIIRAHAEGQLDALERLGAEEVGVMVEWSTAARACSLCAPMEGTVLKLKEARGIIPRHPNCRCAHIPANVGESAAGQKRSRAEIEESIKASIRAEMPKKKKRTLAQQTERSSWLGADKTIAGVRPPAVVREQAGGL